MGELVQQEYPQNYGRIAVGSGAQEHAISPKQCKIGPTTEYEEVAYALLIGTKVQNQ